MRIDQAILNPILLIRSLVGPVKWKSYIPLTWRRPNESRYGQCSKPTCTICAWTFVWNSGRVWPISSHTSYKSSSFGWDPEAKRKELFHSLSRFILVHEPDTDTLLAFTMLRFEVEEEEAVVYWQAIHTAFPTYYYFLTMLWCPQSYDVQVTKAAQGMGLGKELLKELAKIGNVYDMEKIMLTVLKGLLNLMFYKTPRNNSSSKHKSDGVL